MRARLDLNVGADPANRSDIEVLFEDLPEPIDLEWNEDSGSVPKTSWQ